MLRLFRVRACCLVTALFLAAGTTVASFDELLHAGASHDAGCNSADVLHDAANHHVQATPGSASHAPLHCVACHWARAPHLRGQAGLTAARADEFGFQPLIRSIGIALPAQISGISGRSPPRLA